MPDGTKEERARAAKIAREIEHSEKSKRMAFLENDDEERDLDKETVVPMEGSDNPHHKRMNRLPRGNKNFNQNFNQKKETPVVENRMFLLC